MLSSYVITHRYSRATVIAESRKTKENFIFTTSAELTELHEPSNVIPVSFKTSAPHILIQTLPHHANRNLVIVAIDSKKTRSLFLSTLAQAEMQVSLHK